MPPPESARTPKDFDPEDYLGESFGIWREDKTYDVKIRFSRGEAQFLRERRWHPTQELTELKDGRVVLGMRVSGLPDVARWVLSYGSAARVLAPPELVSLVARHLKDGARNYS